LYFVQKHHVSDENHVYESVYNQTGYFKMSVSVLFQRQWGVPLCTDTIPWKYCTYSPHRHICDIYLLSENFCGTESQLQVYKVHNKQQKELGAFGKNYKWILNTLLFTVQKSVFAMCSWQVKG